MTVSSLARQKAAQAWCTETTQHKEMDTDLAEAFAVILEGMWSQPWLGNATTGQLLDEIRARVDINYSPLTAGNFNSAPGTGTNP